MSHLDYPDAASLDARVRLHQECSINTYGWQRWVMDNIAPHLRGSVLEIGTGPAYLWLENAKRVSSDVHLVLSDRSHGMIEDARTRLEQEQISADFVLCDAARLPSLKAHFDLVIANHVLFLVEVPAQVISEIARVLSPGAVLCATTNHRDHLAGLLELFVELAPSHFGHLVGDELRQRRERFNFVSGADQLLPFFDDVTLITYEDGLAIDQAEILEPWLNYWAKPGLDSQGRAQLLHLIAGRIAQEGVLRMRKNSGMFIARRIL